MARPDNLSEAYSRIRKNFSYVRVNYINLFAPVLGFFAGCSALFVVATLFISLDEVRHA